jgi:hypothetical protein
LDYQIQEGKFSFQFDHQGQCLKKTKNITHTRACTKTIFEFLFCLVPEKIYFDLIWFLIFYEIQFLSWIFSLELSSVQKINLKKNIELNAENVSLIYQISDQFSQPRRAKNLGLRKYFLVLVLDCLKIQSSFLVTIKNQEFRRNSKNYGFDFSWYTH